MKTTKKVRPIASLQKFNQNETVNTVTINGNTDLADVSIDRLGNLSLTLHSDPSKISTITSTSPLLTTKTSAQTVTLSFDTNQLEILIHQIVEQQLKNSQTVAQPEEVNETVSGTVEGTVEKADSEAYSGADKGDKEGEKVIENGEGSGGDKSVENEVDKKVDSGIETEVDSGSDKVVEPSSEPNEELGSDKVVE